MIRDQAESRHADAGACRPAASTRGATRPITSEPERHCKRQCGAHPCRPQKQATKKRPQCEQCADRTHGVRGHDAPDEVADEVVDPRHAFASRSRSRFADPFAFAFSWQAPAGEQNRKRILAGSRAGPQPSHCSHPGARRDSSAAGHRTVQSCYIQRPHVTRHNTPNGTRTPTIHTQLYTCVPSLSDAEHGSRFLQGFYRGSTSTSRLWLACTSRQSRRLVMDKYRAGGPLGRSAARC